MRAGRRTALPVIRRLFCACAVVAALALPGPSQKATAQAMDLAASAQAALASGDIELARLLALAVLNDHPRNADALAVLAAVGLATREPEAARIVAARSFRAAETREDRFIAARLVARSAFDSGHPEAAKFWLRRAIQSAPDAPARKATVADYLAVRAASPLRFDFDLSLRPSDNVNQGAREAMLTVDGQPTYFTFDGASRALSGFEAGLSAGLRYRLAASPTASTEIGLRAYHRAVWLSDRAKTQAPGASGSDFANAAMDASLFHAMALSPRHSLRFGATLGRTWLGGDPYSDRARLEATLGTAHGQTLRTRLGLSVERQWLASGKAPATAFSLSAGVQRKLASGDDLALVLDLANTVSDDANQENRRVGAQLRYARAKPVAGAGLSATLGVTARDYPVFFNGVFNDTGRQDMTLSGSIDLSLSRLDAFGFQPVLSLEASRTESNISRYQGRSLGLGLRIQSSF